ncbi:hypothetical protein CC79DRAFT_1374519 [Sarocladium strictum]
MVTIRQIAAAALATSIVAAAPAVVPRDDDDDFIKWTEGDIHNVDVYLSNKQFSWGDAHPHHRIGELKDQCNDLSCSDLSTTTIEVKMLGDSNIWHNREITLKAEGQFSKKTEEGSLDALFEIARNAAANALSMDEDVKGTEESSCSGITGSCNSNVHYYDQYYAANEITVQVRNSDDDSAISWLTITAELNPDDSGSEACETVLGAASTVAGTVSGVGGGVFGLATLFCGSA